MGLLQKLLRSGNNQAQTERNNQLTISAAQGEFARGDNENDIAWKKDLAIKFEVLHDEGKEDLLEQKCIKPSDKLRSKFNEQGELVFAVDGKGELIRDGKGDPIPQYVQDYTIDDKYAALRNMTSHVNRLVFLDPKNRYLMELITEDIIEDVKMNSPEEEFDSGQGAYLNSILAEEIMLLNDCTNGNKVKAILENRQIKTLDMSVGAPQKPKGVF